MRWLRGGGSLELPPDAGISGRSSGARLWILLELLKEVPSLRLTLGALVRQILTRGTALELFVRVGIPRETQFAAEALDRLARSLLPAPPDDHDLTDLLFRLFRTQRDAAWLDEAPPALLFGLLDLLDPGLGPDAWVRLERDLDRAVLLISIRAAALGLESDVRERSGDFDPAESPFVRLQGECAGSLLAPHDSALSTVLADCRDRLELVRRHLEDAGVSVDLVFRIELIETLLSRVELLTSTKGPKELTRLHGLAVMRSLVRAGVVDRSLRELFGSNVRLLARKIIERAGHAGGHYITATRAEYFQMLRSSAGGGALTAVTATMKFFVGWMKFPPFFEGLFASLNYAGSFLAMQALGFTLATKQPSVTAAALAASLESRRGPEGLDGLVDQIARTARSQLAAVLGNIGAVIPAVFAIHVAWVYARGAPFLDTDTADYVVHSLHPLESGTIAYAALTGVMLWAASIAAGWLENWFAFRRLPDALARNRRLVRILRAERARALAERIKLAVSGIGGNIALGFFLGMLPIVGKFFGAPLDVRHVTLSTGSLVFAVAALEEKALQAGVAWALAGVAITGLLNFSVSFALALLVALRAKEIAGSSLFDLARALLRRFWTRPLEFFWPRADEAPAAPDQDPAH